MSMPRALSRSRCFLRTLRAGAGYLAALIFISVSVSGCSGGGPAVESMQGHLPCPQGDALDSRSARCEIGHNVLMAMASGQEVSPNDVVEEKVLEEQRGGFISVGGLRVDFGFEFHTMVNGTPQLTSVLSYNDIVSGNGMIPSLNTVTVSGNGGGTTDIIHTFGPNGISALVLNSEDGVRIDNISTLAIDIIGLGRVHRGGRALTNGGAMPMEMQQSIVRSLQ